MQEFNQEAIRDFEDSKSTVEFILFFSFLRPVQTICLWKLPLAKQKKRRVMKKKAGNRQKSLTIP